MRLLSPPLQSFVAICNLGTVHAAARFLRLTQAAVTHRLAGLEQDLGATLFLRSRKGMTLTPEGQKLLRYCRQAIELEGEALPSPENDVGPSRISVEGPSSVLRSRIIPVVGDVLKMFPSVAVQFTLTDTESSAEGLRQGRADLVIIEHREVAREFDSKILNPEQYVLVTCESWTHRKLEDIISTERIVDFDPSDQMTHRWLNLHGFKDRARSDRHFANNTDALAWMVAEGLGYSVLAREFAKTIDSKRIAIHSRARILDYSIALAWYPRNHPPPWFKAIIKAIH